ATASSGGTVHLSWTVGNFGTGSTDVATWYDRVVLSANDKYGDGDDIYVTSVRHAGALGVGESYTADADVQLPIGRWGTYWVFIETDETHAVFEYLFESNNIRKSDSPISISAIESADLGTGKVV